MRARLERDGVEALHAELAQRDPVSAERLKPRDRTRIARALEVVEATGRSLTDWHRDGLPPLLPPGAFRALFLAPEREQLYARIDARFDAMLAAGALDEVAALAARKLDPLLPAMKAHGVPALIRHLKGEITLEQAAEIGRADTRHYAKRQFTWFRHQLPEFEWVQAGGGEGKATSECVMANNVSQYLTHCMVVTYIRHDPIVQEQGPGTLLRNRRRWSAQRAECKTNGQYPACAGRCVAPRT